MKPMILSALPPVIFEQTCQVYIVTPDKDLAQLVHDGVKILKPGKNQNELELFGKKEVIEQFGIAA